MTIFKIKKEPQEFTEECSQEIFSTIKIESVQYACPNINCNRVFDKRKSRNTHFSVHCRHRRNKNRHLLNHYHNNHLNNYHQEYIDINNCDNKPSIKPIQRRPIIKKNKKRLKKNLRQSDFNLTCESNIRKCVELNNKKRAEILKKRAEITKKRQLTMKKRAILKSESDSAVNGNSNLVELPPTNDNNILGQSNRNLSAVSANKKKKTRPLVQRFACPNKNCMRNYKTIRTLKHHLKFCNKNHKYRCHYCPFKSQFKYTMRTHLRTKHSQRQFRFRVIDLSNAG